VSQDTLKANGIKLISEEIKCYNTLDPDVPDHIRKHFLSDGYIGEVNILKTVRSYDKKDRGGAIGYIGEVNILKIVRSYDKKDRGGAIAFMWLIYPDDVPKIMDAIRKEMDKEVIDYYAKPLSEFYES
jgi:hypothetical protein